MKNGTEGNGVVSVTSHHVFSLFLEELQFRGGGAGGWPSVKQLLYLIQLDRLL